jgi:PUA domain protein
MPEKFRRYFLRAKDTRAFLGKAKEKLGVDLEHIFKAKVDVELIETEFAEVYLINGKPLMAKTEEKLFPTLVFDEFLTSAPKVFVDMGAILHVCNGANIMAPGIVRFEGEFTKGDFVLVMDEKYRKPLAIGEAVYNVEEAVKVKHGIIIKNIHFVGDKIWDFVKKFEVKS